MCNCVLILLYYCYGHDGRIDAILSELNKIQE